MPERLIYVLLPPSEKDSLDDILDREDILDHWHEAAGEDESHLLILVRAGRAEQVLDAISTRLETADRRRIVMLEVAASLPRPADEEGEKEGQEAEEEGSRISREELYDDISSTVSFSAPHAVMMGVSAMVAAIGLSLDSAVLVIAAMVIAPLLGPIMALSLSVNLGDYGLALRSLRSWGMHVAIALAFSTAAGFVTDLDVESSLVALRTRVSIGDIILALGAGIAGAIAYTTAAAPGIVGVMVAAALLPALVACGMLVTAGKWAEAGGAMLLFLTNVICVSLAATATFFMQGIRPRNWYEADKARQATIGAMVLLGVFVALLIIAVLLWRYGPPL